MEGEGRVGGRGGRGLEGEGMVNGRGTKSVCRSVLPPPEQMGWGLQTTLISAHSWLSVHSPVVKRRNCRIAPAHIVILQGILGNNHTAPLGKSTS